MMKQKSFLFPLNNSQPIVVTVVLLSVKRIYDVIHRHYTVLCKTNIVDEKFQSKNPEITKKSFAKAVEIHLRLYDISL